MNGWPGEGKRTDTGRVAPLSSGQGFILFVASVLPFFFHYRFPFPPPFFSFARAMCCLLGALYFPPTGVGGGTDPGSLVRG